MEKLLIDTISELIGEISVDNFVGFFQSTSKHIIISAIVKELKDTAIFPFNIILISCKLLK
ncbi:hypothetical protein JYT44_00865 [Caldithrix abyssi]|nr:hypothetical protein [Caldithrix abyssi]